ncbi:uncharacterized protein LA080_005636 [Diaporthe eres]|nr:uncharacterized protein LA080_005636 [Diaporthe eres]
MADPLSITASVAGLISLGVQTVSGITQYLDAVRERKDDVASAKTLVFRMQNLLQLVDKVAAKVEPTHTTTSAFLKATASVQPELQALEEFVRSLDIKRLPSPSHEVLGKVYVQAKKLTYPFHRPTMDRLQFRLDRVNSMLQAALQTSVLDVAIDIESNTSAIKNTLPDLALWRQLSEQITQENVASRYAVARVGDSVVSLSGRFDQGLAKVVEDIATSSTVAMSVLHQDHADKHLMLLQELSETRKGVSDLSDAVKGVDLALRVLPTRQELGRLISKPGQLRELCDIAEETPGLTTCQHSNRRPRIDLVRRMCICRKRVIRSRQALLWGPWQALADALTTQDHFPDCVYHVQGAAVSSKRWVVVFKGLQGLIDCAIEVSFSYSFGAGGCSLSPGFNCYPTIDRRRDPAFRIMGLSSWACSRMDEKDPSLGEFLEQCLETIALLYRRGKASPKAVDLYGRGVLHYFESSSIVGLPYSTTTHQELYVNKSQWSSEQYSLLPRLDTLFKHGVQATMYDIHGSTPDWSMIYYLTLGPWSWGSPDENRNEGPGHSSNWDSFSVLSDFLCGQEPCETIVAKTVFEFPRDRHHERITMELFCMMQRSPATAEAFGCGPLGLAALEGDRKKMEFILANYHDAINELNLLKQTPLHLAVGHPSCVALLLRESGHKLINLPDSGGRRPMEYALFSCLCGTRTGENRYHDGCLKNRGDTSLNTLLDSDCMIPKIESWPRDYYSAKSSLCDNCLRAVSIHLVGRREDLKRLAANNLPRMQATAFGVFSPLLLESNATRVIEALNEYGISVPPSLQVHGSDGKKSCSELTSAYHIYCGPLPVSTLWSLGFRDLDTPDIDGTTPLMFWCKIFGWWNASRCSWLIEHGADLWKPAPDAVSTIGHELYSKVGKLPPFWEDDWEDDEEDPRRHVFNLTQKLAHRDPRDRCRCACSPGGCTPFVRFLQAAFRSRIIDSASGLIHQLPEIMKQTHASVTKVQMLSAVRYATFEMLGIRHTCCHDHPGLTFERHGQDEDLDELRQEDCFLMGLLEDLAAEFEVELEQISQKRYVNKRVSFWHDHWLPRIQQVLESIEGSGIEEPDKVAAEEIGVVWHKQESGQGKGKDCDEDFDFDSESYSGSEDGGYHESDWDSEIDEEGMFDTFRTMEDWTSRLDLIVSKAGLSAGR